MKKFGFTLAEVLITLGIVGVVAALTAPALVKNSGQAKIGPSLMRFVNTWEVACQQLMNDEDLSRLNSLGTFTDQNPKLLSHLSKYMIMTPLPAADANAYRYYPPDGSGNGSKIQFPNQSYQLKDGSIIWAQFQNLASDDIREMAGIKTMMGAIMIDINGLKGNNRTGKEVFMFDVADSGKLIPYGSNMFKALYNGTFVNQCSLTTKKGYDGLACTGKIADNGWKADY